MALKAVPDDMVFKPEETRVLKAAYDDAFSKLSGLPGQLGPHQGLAKEILAFGSLRSCLGQDLKGHSEATLLSFLARQSLK